MATSTTAKSSTTLQGGALYREAAVQLLKAAKWQHKAEGKDDTFSKGAATLKAVNGSNGVLTMVKDGKGATVIKAGTALRWEALVALGTTGKLPANYSTTLKGVVLTKSQRELVATGKLTTL